MRQHASRMTALPVQAVARHEQQHALARPDLPARSRCVRLITLSPLITWPTSAIVGQIDARRIEPQQPRRGSRQALRFVFCGTTQSISATVQPAFASVSHDDAVAVAEEAADRLVVGRHRQRAVGHRVRPPGCRKPPGSRDDDAGRGAVGDQVVRLLVDARPPGSDRRSRTGRARRRARPAAALARGAAIRACPCTPAGRGRSRMRAPVRSPPAGGWPGSPSGTARRRVTSNHPLCGTLALSGMHVAYTIAPTSARSTAIGATARLARS